MTIHDISNRIKDFYNTVEIDKEGILNVNNFQRLHVIDRWKFEKIIQEFIDESIPKSPKWSYELKKNL